MDIYIVASKATKMFNIGKISVDIDLCDNIENYTIEIINEEFNRQVNLIDDIRECVYNDTIKEKDKINVNTKGVLFIYCERGMETLRDYVIFYNYKDELDKILYQIFNRTMPQLEDFHKNFKDINNLDLYILRLDEIMYIFSEKDIALKNETLNEVREKILSLSEDRDNILKARARRRYISKFLLYNCERWRDDMKRDPIEIVSQLDEFVAGHTYDKSGLQEAGYYKNLLKPENWNEFEKMTDLIKNELVRFSININYYDRIQKFLNNEFSKEGVFPADIMFIKQFMDNAISEMILVSVKLYSKAKPNSDNQNFGFDYLKWFMIQSAEDKNEVTKFMGGKCKELIKSAKELVSKMEILRNAYIAHYDLQKIEEANDVKLEVNEFKKIHDISSKVLEILSLYRFNYDSKYMNFIKIHGFKNIVCENIFINEEQHIDLDRYIDFLRLNFKSNLIKRSKEMERNLGKENQ